MELEKGNLQQTYSTGNMRQSFATSQATVKNVKGEEKIERVSRNTRVPTIYDQIKVENFQV
jgi:hypothetical protein